MLWKSTIREIKTSLERYLAIFAIVALGVGFFSGLQVCKPSMVATSEKYLQKANFYDYQLLTSYGIDEKSVLMAEADENVAEAEASIDQDVIVQIGEKASNVYNIKAISMPSKINLPQLKEGRMPKAKDECVVDSYFTNVEIGDTIKISSNNTSAVTSKFNVKEYKVVGLVSSPLYLDYQRGTSTIGNDSLDAFMYVDPSVFTTNYYTSLYIKLKDTGEFFSSDSEKKLNAQEDAMKALAAKLNYARKDTALADGKKQLEKSKSEYEDGVAEYNRQRNIYFAELDSTKAELTRLQYELPAQKKSLEATITSIQSQQTELESSLPQLEQYLEVLEAALEYTPDELQETVQTEIADTKSQIAELYAARPLLADGLAQAQAGLAQVNDGISQLSGAWKKYNKAYEKAVNEFSSVKAKLDDAKIKLDEAQKEFDEMKTGESYALTRYTNSGYAVFEENANIVSNIAKIFPVFFFLIAALVTMTTMTRMIDEQRTQIGIMKALGYSNKSILGKYMFYSGSAAFFGSVFGFFVGCRLFPWVIWKAYGTMYDFESHLEYQMDLKLGLISLGVALLCSVGATWASCASDFKVAPAQLIRPKNPKPGKRILLERFGFWKKIGFLYKVSFRNIFRYKKRFIMMVLGVCGCTALLIAGFGINTTVKRVADYQYSEVEKYDYEIAFNEDMDTKEQAEFISSAGKDVGSILFLHMSNVELETENSSLDVILVANDSEEFSQYFDLHDGDKKIAYPEDGKAVICRKMHEQYGINKGDKITVRDGMREMTVEVSGICDNYVSDYIYVNKATYQKEFGKIAEIQTALVKAPESATTEKIQEKVKELSSNTKVFTIYVTQDTLDMVDTMMSSLNSVVIVVILCAGLLAFIVLYNLTNINITERIREIATIKVLGFYKKEVSQYVFRENLFLTVISAIVGIPLGRLLLDFVIKNITVNMIYFVPKITILDYVISVVLTFVFTFVVNVVLGRRLDQVSMTESLKSIE